MKDSNILYFNIRKLEVDSLLWPLREKKIHRYFLPFQVTVFTLIFMSHVIRVFLPTNVSCC